MSEFTVGILFRPSHTRRIEREISNSPMPYIIQPLNEEWEVLYIEEEWFYEPGTYEIILALSHSAPLLRFVHPADSGWGYEIYYNGKEVASLYDDKELAWAMAVDVGNQRYPQLSGKPVFFDPRFEALLEEVTRSESYYTALREQFGKCNVDSFYLIDVNQATIKALAHLLASDAVSITFEGFSHRLERFQHLLHIEEMSWKNYATVRVEEERATKRKQFDDETRSE